MIYYVIRGYMLCEREKIVEPGKGVQGWVNAGPSDGSFK